MDPVVHTLLSASEQGHKQRIAALLAENPDRAEVCDDEGSTPLMYAAANGRENVLQLLLQNNVNVNAQNLYGWTALMQAACYGHLTCVFLLLQSGADANLKNHWGCDALVAAAQGGFDTVVQLLLDGVKNQEGAKVNKEPTVSSMTPLMAAAQCGHTDIVTKLIKSGSSVNTTLKTTGWSALMLAAVNNQLETAALLLQHGADRELKDVSKRTVSQLAQAVGHKEMVQLLTGERVDRVSDSDFFDAVKAGQLDKVVAMLEESKALAMAKTKDGVTPLMRAANKGHVEICEVLLKAGCPVNARDSVNGWTALMQATHQRRYAVAKLLGEHGADVNIRGKSGSTALVIANMLGDIEMIRVISNSSQDRVRKTSVPLTSTLATPTPTVTMPTTTNTGPDKAVAPKKVSLPSGPPGLRALPPSRPLDTSELIRRLKMEHAEPSSAPSSAFPASEENPRFPNTRLRSQNSRPSSIVTSINSTTETYNNVSPGVSTSATPSPGPIEGSARSLGSVTPETPRSASYLMPHSPFKGGGGGPSRFLSRSNPPPSDAVNRGGKGAMALQLRGGRAPNLSSNSPFPRQPLVGPEVGSRLAAVRPGFGRGVGIGRREELSFLHKYGGGSSPRLSPSIVLGRPRDMGPLSWQQPGAQRSLEVERLQLQNSPARKRSFTEPQARPRPQSKPALQSALEKASLGEYYQLFSEQELDLGSFLTLTESDLIDLCITSMADRQRLLALIRRLQTGDRASPSVEQNDSQLAPVPATPVFLFQ